MNMPMTPLKLWACAACVALVASCDVVDDPVLDVIQPCESDNAPVFEPLASDVQRVLLEDFTAHQCGNCPPAAELAHDLAVAHPGVVIPLGIHAGDLANTNDSYPTDWTCAESVVFWNDLAFQVNPVGRVNRQADETAVKFQDEWVEAVDLELAKSPAAGLQMAVEFDEAAGKMAVHVHTTWFEDLEGQARLALLVSENHLFGPQLYYGNDPEYVADYEFEHLLRGSLTGAKGLVVAENAAAGDAEQLCYASSWNPAWDAVHTDIVAVLTADNGSVIQVLSAPVAE